MPADHNDRDRATLFRAGAGAQRQRRHARHQGQRRHQDRAQPIAIALNDRGVTFHPERAQIVHMIDLQDRVLLNHSKQHQDAERRIKIQGVIQKPERKQSERNREWETQQNCEWVDRAFEL